MLLHSKRKSDILINKCLILLSENGDQVECVNILIDKVVDKDVQEGSAVKGATINTIIF